MQDRLEMDGYRPGALAAVVALHIDDYAADWGVGLAFETKVAGELAAFLGRYDQTGDLFRCAYDREGRLLASITIDGEAGGSDAGAHLRWFIVSPLLRGQGVGGRLIAEALDFCRSCGYRRVYLTTFAGLDVARHLYESHGFHLVAENPEDQWQGGVREQRFEPKL
ncbi:MAG: GNAT family N-acetyltransferase [Rhodospirillales bacterium]